jgi:hypothetical protein
VIYEDERKDALEYASYRIFELCEANDNNNFLLTDDQQRYAEQNVGYFISNKGEAL